MTTETIPIHAIATVPEEFIPRLEELYAKARPCVLRMLKNRHEKSSKFYKEIPCVLAKSLLDKYQRDKNLKRVSNLTLPVCGDKGKQIKLMDGGFRLYAFFGKSIIPFRIVHLIEGFIRQVEFCKKAGLWSVHICYNTPKVEQIQPTGVLGVDRNSVGNVAVMADLETGKVFRLGLCPSKTKRAMRGRRANLQSAGKFRLLSKLRHKQRRRMTHENHRASRSIVDYASEHRRMVAIEKLEGVISSGSKIRRYNEKNQWAFAQLATFLRYKCALRGIPVIEVDPAFTSQTCSRCGKRHKTYGKQFSCEACGHNEHRDANAAFNIAMRGRMPSGASSDGLSVSSLGIIGDARGGKIGEKSTDNDRNLFENIKEVEFAYGGTDK